MEEKKQKKIWYAPNGFEAYGEKEMKAVNDCLKDGWLAGFGKKSIEFEEKISNYFGKKYGLFVNSGSSACLLSLACLNLPEGSEVITPACGFSTTVAPIIQLKLKPVFVDVDLNTYQANTNEVCKAITKKTSAIMLPNLIGNKPDWKSIKNFLKENGREDIFLIEDSADTITYTNETDVSTTSFYASHIITAGGMGGMVMFNNFEHKKRGLMIRDWGRIGDNSESMDDRFNHKVDNIPYDYKFLYGALGYNMKCCEMCAAFGLVQLNKFDKFKEIRRKNIERYLENLKDVPEILLPNDSIKPNWMAIPLQYKDRLGLLTFLEKNNIQTRVTFAGNITRHPVYREYLQDFENSDLIMKNGFLLGAHHGINETDVDYVCDKIKEYINKKNTKDTKDITMCMWCINLPEQLITTCETFNKKSIDIKTYDCSLYINVDPYPDNTNINKIEEIANKYFRKVNIRYGNKVGDLLHGIKWILENVESKYCFTLPGGRSWHNECFSINKMISQLEKEDDNIVGINMFCDKNLYRKYLLDPCVIYRTKFLKDKILPVYSPYLCWEYQLREIALLENVICRNYEVDSNINKYYGGKYFSNNFKKKNNLFFGNSSSDEEIAKIIDDYGEWHQKVYNIYKNKKNVPEEALINLKKKTLNKKWIYRWTGIRSYVPNTPYYKRNM